MSFRFKSADVFFIFWLQLFPWPILSISILFSTLTNHCHILSVPMHQKLSVGKELQYKPSSSFGLLVATFNHLITFLWFSVIGLLLSFVIMISEKMVLIDCVIFLLMLNIYICHKYEPKLDDIAPSVQVSHYDCSEMTETKLFSLNQVKPCKMPFRIFR